MSGKRQHRERYIRKIEWEQKMACWASQRPPKWMIVSWIKWVRRMPPRSW